jgi:hypothetical protein
LVLSPYPGEWQLAATLRPFGDDFAFLESCIAMWVETTGMGTKRTLLIDQTKVWNGVDFGMCGFKEDKWVN